MKDLARELVEATKKDGTIRIYLVSDFKEARKIITRVLKRMKYKYEYVARGKAGSDPSFMVDFVDAKDYDKIKAAIDKEADKEGWERLGYDMYMLEQ